ncbi:zinc-binding alcohol dehydrogenase family protein [Litoribrevibacter euphylliae]|uniref:Zinc-type alcohol dehydrogenase-like protein n=1 Tax=Litoribrevibacter euphylliae TaxID=1834034 RepID=A0ABV7HJC8_9GAMM
MKAIGYQTPTPQLTDTSLLDIEVDKPSATGHDVLVKIDAISVNPVDTKVRMGAEPQGSDYKILGWDAVGTVEAIGDKVTLFRPGDKVFYAGDLTRPGTNSEFHLVDERIAGLAPRSINNAEAAALPLTAITAWELLFDRLNYSDDSQETVLVVGAAGGVGSILVQLAKQLTQLNIIATASRDESKEWLLELGADQVINHRNPLSEELNAIGIDQVDTVISLTNTDDHLDEIITSLKPQGRLALIDDPKELDVRKLKLKSISLHWEFMYTRSMFQTDDQIKQHQLLNQVASLIDQGKIKTTLAKHLGSINAANVMEAHRILESGTSRGKIVLEGF